MFALVRSGRIHPLSVWHIALLTWHFGTYSIERLVLNSSVPLLAASRMAMTDVYQTHPGMGVDNREWQNNQLQAAAGALVESRRISSGSAFISAPSSQPAAGYSHLSSIAGIPPQPQAQPQRAPRRRGCQHCITCSGLQHHCHSTTVRLVRNEIVNSERCYCLTAKNMIT